MKMTNEEAIIDIRENIQHIVGGKSLDIAISAIEKQIPKKINRPSKCLGVVQFVITSFNMYQSEMFFTDDSENIIYLPDIGKTLFLTPEEAEKALEEKK